MHLTTVDGGRAARNCDSSYPHTVSVRLLLLTWTGAAMWTDTTRCDTIELAPLATEPAQVRPDNASTSVHGHVAGGPVRPSERRD